MEPDRADLITDLYHAALERAPEDRDAFLREACDGDEALRREVGSLLGYNDAAAPFLETPAASQVARALSTAGGRTQMLNRQLGSYTILAPLGAGGMGEVYRARDSKLGRDVAIKILPTHFTSDPERRARFAREARLLATLNHPHIGAIYGLEESDGLSALVLELVEGPTLADRLERGPLPLPEALAIARQVAEALDAAHEKGIVHRDLKPGNIVLQSSANAAGVPSSETRAKVLDFGLAKTMAVGLDGDLTQRPPGSLDGTEEGRILGTPAYMSPEQARGQAVDKRTDIWAFGCVLYEMLTGRRAFDGATISDTFVSILEREPLWDALSAETPMSVRALLERCLRKDPRNRLHDIADARIELDDGDPARPSSTSTATAPAERHRWRERLVWITGAFLVGAFLAGGSLALWQRRTAVTAGDSLEFAIGPPQATRFPFQNFGFAIAPNGSHLAMVAFADNKLALWVQPLGSVQPRQLRGTEGATNPFWSPDSRQIAFFAHGKLKTVGLSGEAPFEVCDAPAGEGAAGTWNRDGIILFGSQAGPLQKVSSTGGAPTPVTALKESETSHRSPWFLPDGQHFLFLARGKVPDQLRLASLISTDSTPLGTIRSNAAYAAGHLLFVQGGLMVQPFDLGSRQLAGEPFPLNDEMKLLFGRGAFSVSETGLLGYSVGPTGTETQLTWRDRAGNRLGTAGEPGSYFDLALSPDDQRVAVSSGAPDGNIDIWVIDLARDGDIRKVTSDAGFEFHPDWSADGKHIAFSSNRKGSFSVFRRPSDGSGSDELLAEGAGAFHAVWSRKDKSIVFVSAAGDLWIQSLEDAQKPSLFLNTPSFVERSPAFSPDGRWIVYSSDRTGRLEIYARPFPSKEPEYKISLGGGKMPRWRSDREVFFLALDGTLMSAHFDGTKNPPATIPQPHFQTGLAWVPIWNRPYDVSANGQRFLLAESRDAPSRTITMVTNWTARLPK